MIQIGGLISLVNGASNILRQKIHNYVELSSVEEEDSPEPFIQPLIPNQRKDNISLLLSEKNNRESLHQPSILMEEEEGELHQSNNIQLYCCIALRQVGTLHIMLLSY